MKHAKACVKCGYKDFSPKCFICNKVAGDYRSDAAATYHVSTSSPDRFFCYACHKNTLFIFKSLKKYGSFNKYIEALLKYHKIYASKKKRVVIAVKNGVAECVSYDQDVLVKIVNQDTKLMPVTVGTKEVIK